MKAAVYHGPRDIRVEDVDPPGMAGDEILVRVHACGICGSDLHLYRLGMFEVLGRPVANGRVMGHELSGEVVEVGSQVSGFQIGDRITGVGVGGFAEYVSMQVSERSPHALPDSISFEVGATLEPLATSLHGVGLAQPAEAETIVILGSGIIGLGCVQVIRALVSSCRIIVVDAASQRLAMAKQFGADATVNLSDTDPLEAVIELTGGAKPVERFGVRGGNADVVIDCAGAQLSPNQGLHMLKQLNGRLVLVALFERPPEFDFNQVVRKHVTLLGSWTWTGDDFRQAIELVRSGRIDRTPLISHQFALADAPEAFATQDQPGVAIKVLVQP
ncbi:D-arabitol-phosphate dehydrogenase [Candidatus Entotheonellaceae bacterium PAL068K]